MVECTVCGAHLTLQDDTVVGELITCPECGTDLEVTGVDPLTVSEAPQADEDWGE